MLRERLERLKAELVAELGVLNVEDRVRAINEVRSAIHAASPFAGEPVDLVLWVPADSVEANDYNPNSVAPPEMKLLEHLGRTWPSVVGLLLAGALGAGFGAVSSRPAGMPSILFDRYVMV